MKKNIFQQHITAIDIGTTKICVLIGTIDGLGVIDIIGIGQHPSFGLKKGVVVNIAMTVDSIKKAVDQAEQMAGVKVEQAIVGISGGHIKSYNSIGVVAIKGKEVKQHDIDRVIDAAKAIPMPKDQYILHVLPQYFRVDGQEQVFDSLGMYGVRLEAQVHIITGAVSSAQNIIKSCQLAGIQVSDIVLEQIASADAVLTDDERLMGVGIIDIGGGTSDFAIYKDGKIRHSKVIPIAGNHFSNDIAVGLSIPFNKAEELKKHYGSVIRPYDEHAASETIIVPLGYEGGFKRVEHNAVNEILRFRAEEIFDLFFQEIVDNRLSLLMPAGIVLTGGGSLLAGIDKLAEEKLLMPVRLGIPEALSGSNATVPDLLKSPIYSTAYGLLVNATGRTRHESDGVKNSTMFGQVLQRMQSWIYDFF